jgi:hypothetical protein
MKTLVLITLTASLSLATPLANDSVQLIDYTATCDQGVYDSIYHRIIQIQLDKNHDLTQGDFDERNNAIHLIRRLCRGQLSSYEHPGVQLWKRTPRSVGEKNTPNSRG